MSEEDYQRGLRGGDAPVSQSEDWRRFKDWKDGHNEYERAEEARLLDLVSPEVARKHFEAREKEFEEKWATLLKHQAEESRRRKEEGARAARSGCAVVIFISTLTIGGLLGIATI